MSSYPVADRVVLITGGDRGIGFATARDLYERGARVVLVSRSADATAKAARELGGRAIGLAADVTDATAMRDVVAQTVQRFGRLDIVIANAGIAPEPQTVESMDSGTFERVIDVNLLGVYRTVHAALPQIIENKGHVVLVASVYSFVNGVMVAPYAMAKAGVEQFGRVLRAELAQHGASASVAYFGFIDTDMIQKGFASTLAQRLEATTPDFLRKRLAPADAGEAIAHCIESRAPRVIAPKRWTVYSVLRGLLNPLLDLRTEHDATIQGILRDANVKVADPQPVALAHQGAILQPI